MSVIRKSRSRSEIAGPGATTLGPATLRGGSVLGSYQTTKTLGRYIAFPPKLAAEIGIEETIFLLNLLYAADEENEWVCRSVDDLEKETSLTYKQQLRVRNRLVDLGLLEEKSERLKHLMYFRVSETTYDALISNLKRKVANLPLGSTSIPKGNLDIKKEEVQEEYSLPKQEELEEKGRKLEDASQVFKLCRSIYRQKTGKSLGRPGKYGEAFAEWVERKTGDVVFEAFKLWLDDQDRKFLSRSMAYPFAFFMKYIPDAVEAYEDKIAGEKEAEVEEEAFHLPKLGPRVGE